MAFPPKADRGFTLLEVLIALTFAAFLLGVTAVAAALYRHALRCSGTETFNGRTLVINPDDSLASGANVLAAELASLNAQADFTVVTDAPWDGTDLVTRGLLPALQGFDPGTLSSPGALRSALAQGGVPFTGQGYTILLLGRQFRILGALTVSTQPVTAPNGDPFTDYQVRLYGDTGSGFAQLYAYEFVAAGANQQTVATPALAAGCWSVILPDPGAEAESSDGTVLPNPPSTLSYALPSNF
jgi:hypothetical protein